MSELQLSSERAKRSLRNQTGVDRYLKQVSESTKTKKQNKPKFRGTI